MILVGRPAGIFYSEQNQKRRKYVSRRLDRVGNQGIGITKNTCQPFYDGQAGIPDNTEIGSLNGYLFVCICQVSKIQSFKDSKVQRFVQPLQLCTFESLNLWFFL